VLEVGLINGLQVPIHAVLARAVHTELRAADLDQPGRLLMGEFEDAPFPGRGLPAKLAGANVRRQVNQRAALDLAVSVHPPGDRGDISLAGVALSFDRARPFHLARRRFQALGA